MSLTKSPNPYEFGQLRETKKKHKRSVTGEQTPQLEIDDDHYQLQMIGNDLRGTLQANIKQYKQLIRK